jgi:hypothetical protein
LLDEAEREVRAGKEVNPAGDDLEQLLSHGVTVAARGTVPGRSQSARTSRSARRFDRCPEHISRRRNTTPVTGRRRRRFCASSFVQARRRRQARARGRPGQHSRGSRLRRDGARTWLLRSAEGGDFHGPSCRVPASVRAYAPARRTRARRCAGWKRAAANRMSSAIRGSVRDRPLLLATDPDRIRGFRAIAGLDPARDDGPRPRRRYAGARRWPRGRRT